MSPRAEEGWEVPVGKGGSLCYHPSYYQQGFRWVNGRAIPQIDSGLFRDPHGLYRRWRALIPTSEPGLLWAVWFHSWAEARDFVKEKGEVRGLYGVSHD